MADDKPEPREIYAWLSTDEGGEDALIMITVDGAPFPLVSIDPNIAEFGVTEAVGAAARKRRATVRLVRYVQAEILDEVEP